MKKQLFYLLLCFLPTVGIGQTAYDAINITAPQLKGTARYMGMGGAFGALGGDPTALKDNPAGLGVYRSSETTLTLNSSIISTQANWNSMVQKEDKNSLELNNFTYVMSIPLWKIKENGLLSSNFSFGFSRVKDFNRSFNATTQPTLHSFTDFLASFATQSADAYSTKEEDLKPSKGYDPYTNSRISWLSLIGYQGYLINPSSDGTKWTSVLDEGVKVRPSTHIVESGGINEYTFGWGGNFNNRLFLGINMNLLEMNYALKEHLHETFLLTKGQGSFDLTSRYNMSGSGVNLKIGAIYLPTDQIRLGASLHTPTFFNISQYTNFDLQVADKKDLYLPERGFSQDIQLSSPLQAQFSVAYLFGMRGLLSAEYGITTYNTMQFKQEGSSKNFAIENNDITNNLQNGHTFKVGTEYKASKNTALRAGYSYATSPHRTSDMAGKSLNLNTAFTNTGYQQQANNQHFTIGFGYREKFWFVDFAYALQREKATYYPYQRLEKTPNGNLKNTATPIQLHTHRHNIVATIGLKL